MTNSIKKVLIESGQYENVIEKLENIVNDDSPNYPVSYYWDEKTKRFLSDINGNDLRREAQIFLLLLKDPETTLVTISESSLKLLNKFTTSRSEKVCINYAVSVAHRRKEGEDLMSSTNVRIWLIISNILDCAFVYTSCTPDEKVEYSKYDMPEGWKFQEGDL